MWKVPKKLFHVFYRKTIGRLIFKNFIIIGKTRGWNLSLYCIETLKCDYIIVWRDFLLMYAHISRPIISSRNVRVWIYGLAIRLNKRIECAIITLFSTAAIAISYALDNLG
ncbi:hypothetical protein HCUR_01391 [Holospora curviuscula]|uniref:Uncharacterized protein n=1 Tax=Holospora curviuscula TaxID=1082868 RepID=A0A2S5R7R7_9PROT|nr:hypothetical protein HCUR_01391 [Holospora curviuscula]